MRKALCIRKTLFLFILSDPAAHGGKEAEVNRALAAGAGEAMRASYAPGEMETLLADCGFLTCEHLRPEDMTAQYLAVCGRLSPGHAMRAPEGVNNVLAVRKAAAG